MTGFISSALTERSVPIWIHKIEWLASPRTLLAPKHRQVRIADALEKKEIVREIHSPHKRTPFQCVYIGLGEGRISIEVKQSRGFF